MTCFETSNLPLHQLLGDSKFQKKSPKLVQKQGPARSFLISEEIDSIRPPNSIRPPFKNLRDLTLLDTDLGRHRGDPMPYPLPRNTYGRRLTVATRYAEVPKFPLKSHGFRCCMNSWIHPIHPENILLACWVEDKFRVSKKSFSYYPAMVAFL